MKGLAYLLATLLGLLGLVFCTAAAATGLWPRWILGGLLLASAVTVAVLTRLKPPATTIVQKIDFTGKARLAELKCATCGGSLDAAKSRIKDGAVFVSCPYCGAESQIEEDVKW